MCAVLLPMAWPIPAQHSTLAHTCIALDIGCFALLSVHDPWTSVGFANTYVFLQ